MIGPRIDSYKESPDLTGEFVVEINGRYYYSCDSRDEVWEVIGSRRVWETYKVISKHNIDEFIENYR